MVLPHAGGAFPYLAGRIEHFFAHFPGQHVSLARPTGSICGASTTII
jgi:hypothetical protein